MTAFILVPGPYTGGWVWQDVAARLREAGAEAHAATLTGMAPDGAAADAEADLETHIQDVLDLIDRIDDPEIVLVGHDYGIHPVFGAADRRPERIARIVHADAGMARDGAPALALVPDPTVHEALAAPEDGAHPGPLPAPATRDDWQRWGSTEGVTDEAIARLSRLAAPQPHGTLTQPLKLTGAAAGLPVTGVLCVANGSSIATLEAVVQLGDPRLQALIDPRITFFELATGHWPMLSAPDTLADVLLAAAKGDGHRLSRPAEGELPPHLRPFLLDLPEHRRERVGRVDLHLPDADGPRPAVLFVHGGPVPDGVEPTPRDWPTFIGYGRYAASRGVVGATLDHRLHEVTAYPQAHEDVAAAVELLRADPRVDPDRIALWFVSAGGLLSAPWIAGREPWLRCVAAGYPILAPLPNWGVPEPRFQPVAALGATDRPPLVLLRMERERAEIAATVAEFLAAAEETAADIEVIDLPGGVHGFETVDHSEEARDALGRTMRAVLDRLGI
ncbi:MULTISPECIES: alpha/beta fold hydrolase [Streptomyces]|uniref:Alpha/beta hydrolase n=1 Tax=Streptomyces solicathayae TaxID=3081768 RepID=A0ABZ0LKX0_9ACTN|nr:alpha/beta fold hydrolase [Streptomyces sp. HUAS YS2]WOX20155.1 alpha/beta hydrolase [Streptomyces sp. HUAS YS2]